jgi:hypothetical protein
MMQEGK